MFRHLQKRQKFSKTHPGSLPTAGSDSDSSSDSDSDSDSSTASQEQSSEGSGEEDQPSSDSDEAETDDGKRKKRGARIPESLLEVLDNPIIYPGDDDGTDHEDSESADASDSEGSTSNKQSTHHSQAQTKAFPICLVCPGKILKTDKLLEEHVKGQAHTRRLARYKDFIHNPPPHTSLSPDASEVIELIDALIGPPPVVPAGYVQPNKKQKRKKRKLVKRTQSEEEKSSSHSLKSASQEAPNSESKKTTRQKNKSKKRQRVRKGKRERQEGLARSGKADIP
ncbi:hypothetical protein PGT21_030335 [Puccinia graminis f. sp. tritici]|uniref:Uncharacterized protein n=1 Tax=Puccinia graminis f. sp. tritici TaxID=56615 RepID=A0A5B0MQB9_PUCGR|nr:hypothetical protein PGTUg99_019675 [Puccinia graminis f. sp. tritici]KAA1094794.1 hypothetical protein PGT21_030335 [Puccinia graminis f. sp. tritici]